MILTIYSVYIMFHFGMGATCINIMQIKILHHCFLFKVWIVGGQLAYVPNSNYCICVKATGYNCHELLMT